MPTARNRATLRRSLSGLAYHNDAALSPAIVKRLFPERFETSVSRLERFAACPFAHFIEYTLKLEPRPEADMADVGDCAGAGDRNGGPSGIGRRGR